MSKLSVDQLVALGTDAVLTHLATSAVELADIKMANRYPRDPMLGNMSIMEYGDPANRTPDWTGKNQAAAKSLNRACIAALLRIGPSALPLVREAISKIKESSESDWYKTYAVRILKWARFRLGVRKWLRI